MGKLEVYKTIIDKEIPYEKLADKIRIDDFVNAFEDKKQILNDNGIKITYGVNVRISNNSEKDILPFSYSSTDFDSVSAAKEVDLGKNIPDFLKEYHLKEVTFCAKYNSLTKNYDISFIDDILEDVFGIRVSRIFSPFYDRETNRCDISTFFLSCNSFLHVNIKYLDITSEEPVYVWICGEDPDVSLNVEKSYLATIVAITNRHDALKYFIREKRLDILKFIMLLKSRRTDDFYIKQREEAVKSAKAAIMSRNMSHNIGSHVMSYLKQNLSSVQDILKNGVLSNILDGNNIISENGQTRLRSNLDKDVKDVALPFLVGMGHFISYLQERQDFIATVATDYIPYNSTINFKDDIYDILNPDKRVKRHAERTTSMTTDNILIGNIARSEGLGRVTKKNNNSKDKESYNDIVLKFRSSFDGDPVVSGTDADKELEAMRGYDLSLPGGILGRQAFFSITENIIRNAAKHGGGQSKESPNLEFTFDIFTKQDVLNKDRTVLTNNDGANGSLSLCQVLEKFYVNASDSNELYYVTITDNCDCTEDSLGKLRKALLEKYIDEEKGTMNNGNKGLKEIRISAAWLRTIRNEDECFEPMPSKKNKGNMLFANDFEKDNSWMGLEKDSKAKAPLIYTRLSIQKNDNWGLQYIICLPIPQALAIISDSDDFAFSQDVQQFLSTYYWKVYTTTEFLKVKDKCFEFILCDGLSYNKVRPYTSSRAIQMNEGDSIRSQLIDAIKEKKLSEDICSTILKQLYLSFAGLSNINQLKDTILIADNGAVSNTNYIRVDSSAIDGEYMYRSHHDTEPKFLAFMRDLKKSERTNVRFVEGVTGNNSTDRLIRHGNLDDIWFYRHLHAMKQQIAVFDERLFSTITGREEHDFSKDEKINTEGYKALTYIQKGIFPFTLIEKDGAFCIVGCICKRIKNEGEKDVYVEHVYNNKYECECSCIAKIHYSHDVGLQIDKLLDDSDMYIINYFHFITIHQGLLDKLYEAFDIKDCPEEKIKVTSKLYSYLSININKDEKTTDFLPGLNIHSGRSKPNKSDMPQQVPFIQFAALEHALSDCKYTIVELLDNARYED